jgi:hypothetical protein
LIVRANVAQKQLDADRAASAPAAAASFLPDVSPSASAGVGNPATPTTPGSPPKPAKPPKANRFHGTVTLDPQREGRETGRIAEEGIAHLSSLVGSGVTVWLDIEAEIPAGVPDKVVRIVTENCRTLKFSSQGFEAE